MGCSFQKSTQENSELSMQIFIGYEIPKTLKFAKPDVCCLIGISNEWLLMPKAITCMMNIVHLSSR